MSSPEHTIADALERAQRIVAQWFVPDGLPADEALDQLVGVLDNRTLLAAQRNLGQPLSVGIDVATLSPRHKVALDLLSKYGVLVDANSLSDAAVERLLPRVNYPRLTEYDTLREWSDRVLGEGEHVQFYLPQAPRRNTHLGTVQYLSEGGAGFISGLLDALEIQAQDSEKESGAALSTLVIEPNLAPSQGPENFALEEEAKQITAGGQRGLNTLHALHETAEELWSATTRGCLEQLLEKYDGEEELDTLEVVTELVGRLDKTVRAAREVLLNRSM